MVTTPSFTLKANTTYLVFAFAGVLGQRGDHATPSSSVGGLTFHTIGSGSQVYNGGKDYESGWWVNGGASDAIGTISVTFVYRPAQIYLQVIQSQRQRHIKPDRAERVRYREQQPLHSQPAGAAASGHQLRRILPRREREPRQHDSGRHADGHESRLRARRPGAAATYFANTPSQNESSPAATICGRRSRSKSSARDHRQHSISA